MYPGVLLIGLVALVFSRPAYGYIDPGVGSVMVQAILAGSAGFLMVAKLVWRRVALRLGFLKGSAEKE